MTTTQRSVPAHDQDQLAAARDEHDAAARAGALRAMSSTVPAEPAKAGMGIPAQAGTSSSAAVIEVLQQIADRLRRGGAVVPVPASAEASTYETALVRGLSIALLLVEVELETIRPPSTMEGSPQSVATGGDEDA